MATSTPEFLNTFIDIRSQKHEWAGESLNPVELSAQECLYAMQAAREAYLFLEEKTQTLDLLQRAGTPEDHLKLKSLRKFALVYLASLRLFLKDHWVPKPLHDYIHQLGKLNDRFGHESYSKYARRVATARENADISAAIDPTALDSWENTQQYVRTQIQQIQDLLASGNLVTVKSYHDSRKSLKLCLNLTQLAYLASPQKKDVLVAFTALNKVIDTMGKEHDKAVASDLSGIAAYDDISMDISSLAPKIEAAIEVFSRIFLQPSLIPTGAQRG